MTRSTRLTGVAAALLLVLAGRAAAQAPAAEPAPAADPAPAPKTIRKPQPKPGPAAKAKPAPQAGPASVAKPSGRAGATGAGQAPAAPTASPPVALAPSPAASFAGPAVACEAGKSALFEGAKNFSIWVTRAGAATIENPLRPLTPEVTQVLQVIIGAKVATAYGSDLSALRRGGTPAALEATLGGPIRWRDSLGMLPDPLTIVSEANEPLAQLEFRACGTAPAVKPPAAEVAKGARKAPAEARPAAPAKADAPARTPPGFRLPQGAIP